MNIQNLYDISVGSRISVHENIARVVGKLCEKYTITEDGTIAGAYVLVLDGRQEVGAEHRGDKWHFWYSRFSRTYPTTSLDRVMGTLEDVEEGRIEKVYSEGDTGESYPRYAFGRRMGKGVFLGISEDKFDVWVNISPFDPNYITVL